ncbi:MAG: molybdopterin-dependent oxidoreductase, partial [Treponema sp.]|nr:molybdopterin-dependent oxidoreductase [Treponema sp.]
MKKKLVSEKLFSLEAKDFYSDCTSDNMLYGSLVRSPAITGNISKITIPNLPEDYYFFTAKDIPGKNKIDINGTSVQIFTDGAVSYNGEVLGIVIGSNKEKVKTLAEEAEISFDINSLESAFQSVEKKYKHPTISIGQSINDLSRFVEELNDLPSLDTVQNSKNRSDKDDSKVIASRIIKTGLYKSLSVEKAEEQIFSKDVNIFSGSWELKQADSLWQETSGAFCKMENGILHVSTATKWSFLLQNILDQALGISEEKIIIHKTKTSGMYSNGMWKNAILATQVALGSFLTGKPVKLVYTQSEQEKFMKPGIQTTVSYKTGVTSDGIIKSMNIDIFVNAGSQNPFAQEIIDRLVIASTNIYKPENLYINARAVTSKTPPTSIYPKIIDGQSFYALEAHIQQISEELHIHPDEFR